jgi:hypothetical protein
MASKDTPTTTMLMTYGNFLPYFSSTYWPTTVASRSAVANKTKLRYGFPERLPMPRESLRSAA